MTAYLIVRAEVTEPDRGSFETWYQTEHLPEAKQAFQAKAAMRGWSDDDASVHVAMYEFENVELARAVIVSDEMKAFIAEFDRKWQGRVRRTREILSSAQMI